MKEQEPDPRKGMKLDEAMLGKMDGTLRRLLLLNDDEIRQRVQKDRQRLEDARKSIGERADIRRPTAGKSERMALERLRRYQRKELLVGRDLAAIIPERLEPVRVRAVVRFTGNRQDLEAIGLEVRSQAQDVFTVVGTTRELSHLAAQPACRRMRSPRILLPDVEHASAQAEIAAVHDPRPLAPNGFQGDGVLVGIIDYALDVTHHGFREPTGSHDTRVLYYWAQTTDIANPPGQNPQQWSQAAPGARPNFGGLTYGRLYTRAAINTALGLANPYGNGANQICCTPALEEHGTHTAGIAAGSGHEANWATARTHIGAAPQATIIHVRVQSTMDDIDTDATMEDSVLDAINFCFEAARFHQMPIVVNVSLGSSFGPHNGSSDFDLGRDNVLNSFLNRSIVWSAGNDNNDHGFRTGVVAAGNGTDNFTLTVVRTDRWGNPINTAIWLDIWYVGPPLDYRIGHGGNNSGWRTAGQDYDQTISGRDIEVERDIEPGGNLHGIRLYVGDARTNDAFTVELRNPDATNDATYYAWSGLQGWWGDLSGWSQSRMTLSDTACGKSILTVGATGKMRPPNPAAGELITTYSGAGPTVDGRIKPEIVAVGGTSADPIISANSNQGSGYTDMFGTSMAAPLTAGAVALLLEAYGAQNIELNQDTIKALLTQHAQRLNLNLDPAQAGYNALERNLYGYGRLRLIAPIDLVQPPVEVDLWVRTAADDYGEEPYIGDCFCGAPDIRVCHAGTNNATTQISWGTTYDVKVTVHNLGDSDAVGTTVRLKYTLPHTAPSAWVDAEDPSDHKLERTLTVDAMSQEEVVFHWCPESAELTAPAGQTHYCLLAEVDHPADVLAFAAPSSGGGSAWSTNIKGTNNVALRNLHIQ